MTCCNENSKDVEREVRRVLSRDLANANITIKVSNCKATSITTGEAFCNPDNDLYISTMGQLVNDAVRNLEKGEVQIFVRKGRVENILSISDLT